MRSHPGSAGVQWKKTAPALTTNAVWPVSSTAQHEVETLMVRWSVRSPDTNAEVMTKAAIAFIFALLLCLPLSSPTRLMRGWAEDMRWTNIHHVATITFSNKCVRVRAWSVHWEPVCHQKISSSDDLQSQSWCRSLWVCTRNSVHVEHVWERRFDCLLWWS